MMNINLDDLDREQAIAILKKIVEEQPSVDHLIQKILNQLDFQLDHITIAQEIFITLDLIDVEDLWHNSGPTRYGYVDPGELAFEMVEDAIAPYLEKFKQYLSNSKLNEAKIICMGILKGLHDFENKSNSQFKDWAPDVTDTLQRDLLNEWEKSCNDQILLNEVNEFFETLE